MPQLVLEHGWVRAEMGTDVARGPIEGKASASRNIRAGSWGALQREGWTDRQGPSREASVLVLPVALCFCKYFPWRLLEGLGALG